jgi:hypothetical protein
VVGFSSFIAVAFKDFESETHPTGWGCARPGGASLSVSTNGKYLAEHYFFSQGFGGASSIPSRHSQEKDQIAGTGLPSAPLWSRRASRVSSSLPVGNFQKGYVMARNDEHKGTSNRGFASMDQAKQRAIASKGGQSVPPEKRSFSQDPQLAAQAGRKGGESVPPEGRSFSQNRELAAEAGRKGGQARGAANRGAANRDQNGGKTEARRQGQDFQENRDIAAEGARKSGMSQRSDDSASARSASPDGSDNYGRGEDLDQRDELNTGNQDVESGDLSQSPGRPSDIGSKVQPHGVR